ncbi:RagB/SusD family nutrient uptake outer membrane protein [Muribaculum intestinale]|uniref:RagB/SusD family nutrient uptake outer membrane protein n=1 Tax=Muribaculum intestinale TaxID=1796646 RepID=A0A1B1SCA3_9BACT|nr:RagB/SusD family nutrient uptake outer membrane protein [Muribaculum intestinale]ANU64463.2 RagB/SusD family nutrient uptake outer membrane protein [Muribaculum intestinale]ASB37437.1 RagB/SusD family nutrient uptake outer membrane protein [Muribaculum intestinale]PWB01319.1 RagB/SusD family nutrient uptake outer membrane protein [Muribaculum intestinale]PWB08700.1 RagB/SusD family nutrient uptake outer membrane protein [Muribaculum intestinale]QQR08168.1 RagB/SusD family nutrient uptake ou
MKTSNIFKGALLCATMMMAASCADLDLQPLTEPSSGTWNSKLDEVRISVNDLYRAYPYNLETRWFTDGHTDDFCHRNKVYDVPAATLTSSTSWIETTWSDTYKAISRCNRVLESLDKLGYNSDEAKRLAAEARLFRAYFYARLISLWGDVPFCTGTITIEEARQMGRTPVADILPVIYSDYDYAYENLPESNIVQGIWRVNRYVAASLKCRIALTMKDWEIARDAARLVMASRQYSLYPDFGALFRDKTMDNGEYIFCIANSIELGQSSSVNSFMLRTTVSSGASGFPSWDLLAAFECTDGKPIDESPLFDPHNPYLNRDPRCNETFVAPGSVVYGCVYNPSPSAKTVLLDGKSVTNKDSKINDQYAAPTGTCLRKGAQDEWRTGKNVSENPTIIIRYADVLLMYAEAKIELGELDASMLNAINDVRARAYKTTRDNTAAYPALALSDQNTMRLAVRKERRVEFAWEGRRFFDLLRWDGWMEKAFSHDYYAFPTKQGMVDMEKAGDYYWPSTPEIDECGFADFKPMFDAGKIVRVLPRKYDSRFPLLPIPAIEVSISNGKISQNPGW